MSSKNNIVMLTAKTIKVQSENGFPVIGAHVINLDGSSATITNLDGVATIKALPDHTVKISHVSGSTKEYKFSELPEVVELTANELDEVIITAPKKSNFGVFALMFALGLGYIIYQKNKA